MTTNMSSQKTKAAEGASPEQVLVVLPALNEECHIEACLRSVMSPKDWMARASVVVVDGGSLDKTRDIVRQLSTEFPNVSLIDNPKRLQSAAINLAVDQKALPRHKYMVRCDVHAIYPHGYVRDVVTTMARLDVASVATPMDAVGKTALQRASAWIVDTPLGSGGSAHRGGRKSGFVDHGHHAGLDLAWFNRIGGYDPNFSHNEDAEYDFRLIKAGGKIWLDADIRLSYVMRTTLRSLARQYWNYGRGRARTVVKHHTWPRSRQLIPAANLMMLCVSFLAGLVWPVAFAWCAFYASMIVLVSAAGFVRQHGLGGTLAGPALATMHVGWGVGFIQQLGSELLRHLRTSRQTDSSDLASR